MCNAFEKKIILLLPSFGGGGVERTFVTLANEFYRRGIEIKVVVLRREGPQSTRLNDNIEVESLEVSRISRSVPSIIELFRRHKEWGAIVGPGDLNVAAALAVRICSINGLVLTERTNLSEVVRETRSYFVRLRPYMMRATYGRADHVVGVSQGVVEDLQRYLSVRVQRVYNPTISDDFREAAREPVEHEWFEDGHFVITSVGRLAHAKRYDVLLRAFSNVVEKYPNARLALFGEGELRGSLESLATELGVRDHVWMPGYLANPYAFVARSSVFACSSSREGLSNALVEAVALGLPIVSTDHPSGAREILDGGSYGTLVPIGDVDSIAAGLQTVYEGHYNGRRAPESHIEQFTVRYAADQYLELLRPGNA